MISVAHESRRHARTGGCRRDRLARPCRRQAQHHPARHHAPHPAARGGARRQAARPRRQAGAADGRRRSRLCRVHPRAECRRRAEEARSPASRARAGRCGSAFRSAPPISCFRPSCRHRKRRGRSQSKPAARSRSRARPPKAASMPPSCSDRSAASSTRGEKLAQSAGPRRSARAPCSCPVAWR